MAHIADRGARFSHLLALEIKGAAAKAGVKLRDVAEAADVDYSTLSRYFSGKRALPSDTFALACEFIRADPQRLVGNAYEDLVAELGPWPPVDADVVALYTPAGGIPLGIAAKRAKEGPLEGQEETFDGP